MNPYPLLLYIDDTQSDTELLGALLDRRGIGVDAAFTGAQGIGMYDPGKHMAVIIDWNLIDMDGPDVAQAMLTRHPACAIAFISGLMEKAHITLAESMGIKHCFEKSVHMQHIDHICEFVHQLGARRQAV